MIDEEYFTALNGGNYFWDKNSLKLPLYYPLKENNNIDSYTLEEIAESLAYFYKKNPRNIIFDHCGEGLVIEQLSNADKIISILISKYNIPLNNVLYVSGLNPILENVEYYKQISLENNQNQFPIIFINHYEKMIGQIIKDNFAFQVRNFIKPKKFVSFNRVPRIPRIALTALLIKKNLLDQSYYSLNLPKNYNSEHLNFYNNFTDEFCNEIKNIIDNHKHKFPMVLSKKHEWTDNDWFTKDDLFYFNNSRFSIVQETNAFKNLNHYFHNQLFFSEKTYRVIGMSSPFIMVNRPHALKGLKSSGYKTFSPFINESYDDIENDEDRIKSIADEIERLCNIPDDEWTKILEFLIPIIEFNYNKLVNSRLTLIQ